MNLIYELVVKDDSTGYPIIKLTAYSQESLEEKFHKIEKAIKQYEREQEKDLEDETF